MISIIRWLQEPEDVRQELIRRFRLQKAGGRIVENNRLVSDGISADELYTKFSVRALQEFTGIDLLDVYELFSIAVEIIKAEKNPNHEKSLPEKGSPAPEPDAGVAKAGSGEAKKRPGRPKKKG